MKPLPTLIVAALALFVVPFACAGERLVVETGHIGPVNALAYDKQDSLIFSGGSDGTVRAWNSDTHELVGVLQTGHLPIQMLAVDPSRHEIAAFETDNLNTYRISAWNWETGKRLFVHSLSEAPVFMQYSPAGSFLVYGITAWRSLYFLDASTGAALPYFRSGIGIVSAIIISDSEKSMMTYSPSGQIQYWTIQSGNLKQSYQTLPNLSAVSFTPNSRYLIGAYNDNLVMVDLIGGQTVSSVPLTGIQNTSLDPGTNEVAVSSVGDNGPELSLYSLAGGLQRMGAAFDAPPGPISDIVYANGVLVASQQNSGTLLSQSPYLTLQSFGKNNLLQLDDVAVNNHQMLVTSSDHVLVFGSSFFGLTDSRQASSVSFSDLYNPYQGPTGVVALNNGQFVLWNQTGQSGSYRIYDDILGIGSAVGDFPAPFVEVRDAGSGLLTLDSQGTINLLSLDSGTSTFSYSAFGLQSVAYVSPHKIIAGLSQTGTLNTSLLQLNPATGETVPIPDSSMLVFDLSYDPSSETLYSLDIQNGASGMSTVLKSHPLSTLGAGASLLSYRGEDQKAGLAIDAAANSIFTSLGFDGVKQIVPATGFTTKLEATDHVPRKLLVNGEWVVSLNTDSTITVWNRMTGKRIFDLYIFKDLAWAAILANGQYIASAGATKYIKVFNGMKQSSSDVGSYQYSF